MRFANLAQLTLHFNDDDTCRKHLESIRWNGKPKCPHCENTKNYTCKDGRTYKCPECNRKFTVLVNSIFENTKIPLRKWYIAIFLFANHKKGISSIQLSKDIGITQKSAWYMLQRIREAFKDKRGKNLLKGIFEVDETYIGGKQKNKHYNKRTKGQQGRGGSEKLNVFGIKRRGGKVISTLIKDVKGKTLKPIIYKNVERDSTIMSDEWRAYNGLDRYYEHKTVDHAAYQYVNGDATTNSIENYWSHVKRTVIGTYHSFSRQHAQRYLEEFDFRHNTRNSSQAGRFRLTLMFAFDKRVTLQELIG